MILTSCTVKPESPIVKIISGYDNKVELQQVKKSIQQINKNGYKSQKWKSILNTIKQRQCEADQTKRKLYRINEKRIKVDSSIISIPNAGRNSSDNVDLNEVKSKKGSEKGGLRKSQNDQESIGSDIDMPNAGQNPFTQTTNVDIPNAINLGGTTEQIQNNLAQGQGLNSLQSYKQFIKQKLLVNGKFVTTSLYEAFSFQIFELLVKSDEGRQITIKVKDALYRRRFDTYLIESQWDLIRVHGGDDISDKQIKRLILDYMIKIFQDEQSVPLIQQYYILSPILVLSVRQYVRINIGTQNGKTFQDAFRQKNINVVYQFFAKTFGLKLRTKGNTYTFEFENNRLIIQNKDDEYFSWIQ